MKDYYVYILRSMKDQSYYIGYTFDLEKRLSYHNSGKSRYTSRKIPWELVYTEKYTSKSEAIRREQFLKRQRNREFYRRLIDSYNEAN